ncbi:hypothetical protein [Sorangium sp. So ce1000]
MRPFELLDDLGRAAVVVALLAPGSVVVVSGASVSGRAAALRR